MLDNAQPHHLMIFAAKKKKYKVVVIIKQVAKAIVMIMRMFLLLSAFKFRSANFFVMALVSFSKGHVIIVAPPYLIRLL